MTLEYSHRNRGIIPGSTSPLAGLTPRMIQQLHQMISDGTTPEWLIGETEVEVTQGSAWDAQIDLEGDTAKFHFTFPPGGVAWYRGVLPVDADPDTMTAAGDRGEWTVLLSAATALYPKIPVQRPGWLTNIPSTGSFGEQKYRTADTPQRTFTRYVVGSIFSSSWQETTPPEDGILSLVSGDNLDQLTEPGTIGETASSGAVAGIAGRPSGADNQFRVEVQPAGLSIVSQTVTMKVSGQPTYRRWTRFRLGTSWLEWVEEGQQEPPAPSTVRIPSMVGWGSSTMRLADDQLDTLADTLGGVYENGAYDGDWAQHTVARLGAVPPALTFPSNQIPASGTVTVTASNLPLRSSGSSSWTGTVAGVAGTLTVTSTGITFARASAGAATAAPAGSPFLPTLGTEQRHADVIILNIGKNNIGRSNAVTDSLEATAAAWAYVQPMTPRRTIVLGHFHNTGWQADSPFRADVDAINNALEATYGDAYVDLAAALTSPDVWDWTGITPTTDDLAEQALGNMPPSLGQDAGHLNPTGTGVLVRLINEWLEAH